MDNDDCCTADISDSIMLDSLAALIDLEARHYRKQDYCCRQQAVTAGVQALSTDDDDSNDSSSDLPLKNSPSSTSLHDVQDIDRIQQSQSSPQSPQSPDSFRIWRHQMIEWATTLVDSFDMDRELVAMSTNLLDRYVAQELAKQQSAGAAATAPITREDFQLFSMTCLYIVIKLQEPYPRKLGVESLVNMSRGFYSVDDVQMTERDILTALHWMVHPPTSHTFVKLLLEVLPHDILSPRLRHTAMTLTELAMIGGSMISCKESIVGLASVVYSARMDGVAECRVQGFLAQVASVFPIQDDTAEFENVYRSLELAYGF